MERYNFLKGKGVRENKKQRREIFLKKCESRLGHRDQMLDTFRQIETSPLTPAVVSKVANKKSRLELLKEWKLEKEKKKLDVIQKKKPVFKVGVVHYKASGSPKIPLRNITNPSDIILSSGVKTRSQTRGAMSTVKKTQKKEQTREYKFTKLNKMDEHTFRPIRQHEFKVPKSVVDIREKLTVPVSPRLTKSNRKSILHEKRMDLLNVMPTIKESDSNQDLKRVRRSIFPNNDYFEMSLKENELPPKQKTRRLDNFNIEAQPIGNEANASLNPVLSLLEFHTGDSNKARDETKEERERRSMELEALVYSPFVCKRRGKEPVLKDDVDEEIVKEEELRKSSIATFRLFLLNETKRLTDLADKWKQIAEVEDIPGDVVGEIDAAKGKTKLLTTDKFKQFEGLIDKLEAREPNIRLGDLQGFQDWVNLEVMDLDNVFLKLKELQDANWKEPKQRVPSPHPAIDEKPKLVQIPPKVAQKKRPQVSNLRAHILAQRQKMQAGLNASTQPKSNAEETDVVSKKEAKPLEIHSTSMFPTERLKKAPDSLSGLTDGAGDSALTCNKTSPRTPRIAPYHKGSPPPSSAKSLYKTVLSRPFSGLEIVAASSRARSSLTPTKSPAQTPAELDVPMENLTVSCVTPQRSILKNMSTPVSSRKTVGFTAPLGLDLKYLLPAEETPPDQSPVVISLVPSGSGDGKKARRKRQTPNATPVSARKECETPIRRSERIAAKTDLTLLR